MVDLGSQKALDLTRAFAMIAQNNAMGWLSIMA
jgi:hypothetical protein